MQVPEMLITLTLFTHHLFAFKKFVSLGMKAVLENMCLCKYCHVIA
jgi:hypothetical protein